MFKGISWSSFFLFMLVAVVVYYIVVAFLYYRPEIMALIQGKGKISPGSVPQAPKQPVLVVTGSAFAEPEPDVTVAPVPEPHLPAEAAAAAAALAAATAEASEAQETKELTMDDGTGKVLSPDDAAVANEYENPTKPSEEADLAEAKRLLELGKEDNSSNSGTSAVVEGSNIENLNQNEGSIVGDNHIITKFTKDDAEGSGSDAIDSMMEPVDLNDDAQPLEMIQVDEELEVSDTLIGAGDLSNLLDDLTTGEIGAEDLETVAPVFNETELSTRFSANKKRRNQEIESMFPDE